MFFSHWFLTLKYKCFASNDLGFRYIYIYIYNILLKKSSTKLRKLFCLLPIAIYKFIKFGYVRNLPGFFIFWHEKSLRKKKSFSRLTIWSRQHHVHEKLFISPLHDSAIQTFVIENLDSEHFFCINIFLKRNEVLY